MRQAASELQSSCLFERYIDQGDVGLKGGRRVFCVIASFEVGHDLEPFGPKERLDC